MSRAAYQREWRKKNPEAYKNNILMYRYGISIEQYNEMLKAQGNVCAICHQDCRTGMALAVDHDPDTGKVRGLLCRACNGGISAMGAKSADQVENLERAAEYLRRAAKL